MALKKDNPRIHRILVPERLKNDVSAYINKLFHPDFIYWDYKYIAGSSNVKNYLYFFGNLKSVKLIDDYMHQLQQMSLFPNQNQ